MKKWYQEIKVFYEEAEEIAKGLEKLDNKDLFSRYVDYLDKFIEIWAAPLAMDVSSLYTEKDLLNAFKKETKESKWGLFPNLCHPVYISFVGREHISLLKLALLYKKKSPLFDKALEEHQKSFYWIENNYRRANVLRKEYFLEKVKKEAVRGEKDIEKEIRKVEDTDSIRKKQQKIIKNLRISKELTEKLLFTQEIGKWGDYRKEMTLRGNHYVNEFLKEISKRMNVTLEESYWMRVSETISFFKKGKNVEKGVLKGRSENLIYMIEQPEKESVFSGKDAIEIIDALEKEEMKQTSEIKGIVASTGNKKKLKGKVRIILDAQNTDFKKGEIIVASMTRPEYVPLMKKAIAIITDEGGITSHASIASRELNIPCIIGTKNAKKILKDGDVVEMDLEKGSVRKIR